MQITIVQQFIVKNAQEEFTLKNAQVDKSFFFFKKIGDSEERNVDMILH